MEMAEVEAWLKSLNKELKPMTQEEIKEFLAISIKEAEQKKEIVEENEVIEEENDSDKTDEQPKSTEANEPQETASGIVTIQNMAGTYSGSAGLTHVEEDVESPNSLPVTLQLNESGTGTVNVNGFGGTAQYAGNNVSFSVTMKEGSAVVNCVFDGTASRNGSQTLISGNMHFSMMGTTFATYTWSAQK
jgi:hypothetical protein